MSGWYVELDRNDSPLCPKSIGLVEPGYDRYVDQHRAWIAIQNEVYEDPAFPRDADHELIGGQEAWQRYHEREIELAKERLGIHLSKEVWPSADRMRLHHITTQVQFPGRYPVGSHFETAYLVCPVCLFILPGQLIAGYR